MYSVDDTVKALALAPARHIYSMAIFGSKSGTTWDNDRTYSDTDSLISAKIDIGSSSGGLTIGAAYSAKLTLKLMGDVTVYQTDRIIMRVGFYNSDGTKSDKIGLGWFYVDTITRKDKLTTVVAYDKMLRGAKIYKPTALTFPCRASAILDDICDKMGVSLRDGVTMPYDPIINEAPTKGKDSDGNTLYYTRREILGYLASIMGGNWFFDAGGHLAFTQFVAVSDTFAAANSTAADISSDAYAVTGITWNINGVSYSRFDDEDAAGMLEFSNPLKVDAKEPIMGAVEQRLVGLTYHSGTIQRQGCGWFELGDIVNAYRKDGTSAPVLITGINSSIEGGAFTEKIYSSALTDSQSNYTSGDVTGQTVPQSVAQEEAATAFDGVAKKLQTVPATWVDTSNSGSVDFHCVGSSAANNVYASLAFNGNGFLLSGEGKSLLLSSEGFDLYSGPASIHINKSYVEINCSVHNQLKIYSNGGISVENGKLEIYGETDYGGYGPKGSVEFNTNGFVIRSGGVTLEATSDGLFINGKKVLTEE